MFLNKYKVIGILGGMGPDATVDLYRHIIELTPADNDQDHIPTLIFSNPKVPDRTESIINSDTEMIITYLRESAVILEKGGADFIVIPCNTAHSFYDDIRDAVSIPVIHLIRETVRYIIDNHPGVNEVGLLGTKGTLSSGLYQNALNEYNIKSSIPGDEIIDKYIMKGIYSIKSGKGLKEARKLLINAIDSLPDSAKKTVVMGCTEIPLAFKEPLENVNLINPTRILAENAVRMSSAVN
jgi:aspartate racemase